MQILCYWLNAERAFCFNSDYVLRRRAKNGIDRNDPRTSSQYIHGHIHIYCISISRPLPYSPYQIMKMTNVSNVSGELARPKGVIKKTLLIQRRFLSVLVPNLQQCLYVAVRSCFCSFPHSSHLLQWFFISSTRSLVFRPVF